MTPDELETRAQQIHAVRHRAGTGQVCGSCRRRAAGHRSLLDRLLYPTRPNPPGFAFGGVVLALCAAAVITGNQLFWLIAWFAFAAQVWLLFGPPQDRSHIPSK